VKEKLCLEHIEEAVTSFDSWACTRIVRSAAGHRHGRQADKSLNSLILRDEKTPRSWT